MSKIKDWKHQDIAIERFTEKEIMGLLFDCGTGKTRTAIKIAENKDMPVLVLCPKVLCSQWKDAIEEHGNGEEDVFVFQPDLKNRKWYKQALDHFIKK